MLFDATRTVIHCRQVMHKMRERENIAGEVIFTISLDRIDNLISDPQNRRNSEYRLTAFRELCLEFLKKAEKRSRKLGMKELSSLLSNIRYNSSLN